MKILDILIVTFVSTLMLIFFVYGFLGIMFN